MVKNGPVQSQVLFEADMSILRSMMDWIHDHLLLTDVTDGEKRKIEVALEEALVNIISYAYKKRGGQIEITLYYSPNEELCFTIKDKGIPFNPLRVESEMESNLPLEEREEGGLGIPMIHKIMDDVEYERLADTNVLRLKKKCA